MIRIATTYQNNQDTGKQCRDSAALPAERLGAVERAEQPQLDILCCQIKAQDAQVELRELAASLQMSCSSTMLATGREIDRTETALSIFTGSSVWVLNSGSISLSTASREKHRVQFALVRKASIAVLVINMLCDGPQGERQALLHAFFAHQLLKEHHYGAVILCAEHGLRTPRRGAAQLTAGTGFKLHSNLKLAGAGGALMLFMPQDQGAAVVELGSQGAYCLDSWATPNQGVPGEALMLEFQVQAVARKKSKKPRFPLSFAEQWAGYKENLRPSAAV
ncbi:MAG: hypothetical protein GX087_04990 [Desulfobulbaceae bacterium]|nr:hypothetical protein [Desulfobulbaceae bacterium]